MKILQISPHYIPAGHYGGVQQAVHALSKALVRAGHEVKVVTTSLKSPQEDLESVEHQPVWIDGVAVHYEPVALSRYWGFSPALARQAWRQAAWADIVLIHFHYQFASLAGGWVSRLRGKPYAVFTHGSLNRFSVFSRGSYRKRCYLRMLEGGNFSRARFVAYQSQEEMESSLQPGRASRVVPNGIFPEEFCPGPAPGLARSRHPGLGGKRLFLYLGRLDEGKGLALLLRAFDRLRQTVPSAHLVLAGGDERGYEATLRQMVRESRLESSVTFAGFVGGEAKLDLLRDADVFVLPSRSEGLSMALLEAMQMGLPVVVTDRVGLWRNIREQGCGLVVPYREDELYQALEAMALSANRQEMGAAGHRLVHEQFDWDRIAATLLAEFGEVSP